MLVCCLGDFTKHSEKMLSGLQKYWDNTELRVLQQRPHWLVFTSFYKQFAKISEGGTSCSHL
jgi:hypothetical protein